MAAEIILPRLDEGMTSGKILNWLKKEGDKVEKGDIVFELETEKVTFEVEAPTSGILNITNSKIGEEIPVGEVVAYVLQPGETAP
ncbi:biotin/lipoyl-containing protein [Chloroflexota bacterium]